MRKSECYIGQRVEATVTFNVSIPKTITGTIVEILPDKFSIGVELDEEIIGGHSCDGKAKNHRGWYFSLRKLKPIETEENEIKLTFDSIL